MTKRAGKEGGVVYSTVLMLILQTALLRLVCIANGGLAKGVGNDGDYEPMVAVCCVVCCVLMQCVVAETGCWPAQRGTPH
jgi:hypothetical protein